MNHRPIGIFDSGIGGLTVARAIHDRMPDESTIYLGDTARVPYGPKSPETVRRYAGEILDWLLAEGVKAVVVACNTASAHALDALRARSPVPVFGVIAPGSRAARATAGSEPIGVIATAGTIASHAYRRAIHDLDPDATVIEQACPLFVPLVEEGWLDHPATRLVAEEYLRPLRAAGITSLVLGCTHYPLLKPLLAELLGSGVRLIDSADEVAEELSRALVEKGIEAPAGATPVHRWVATDDTVRFGHLGRLFTGRAVEAVERAELGADPRPV